MIEFLLNLAWLSLLAPAFVLWNRRRATVKPAVALFALACLLLLLFPVISVSDDFSSMRAEMEDATSPERSVDSDGHGGRHSGLSRIAHMEMIAVVPQLLADVPLNLEGITFCSPPPRAALAVPTVNPRAPPSSAV